MYGIFSISTLVVPMQTEPVSARWTLADLASTWRFWSLIGVLIAAAYGVMVFRSAWPLLTYSNERYVLRDLFPYFWYGGNGFGILLGIVLAQANSIKGLAVLTTVCMGIYVIAWFALPEMSVGLALFVVCVGQLVRWAIAFIITVLLAGAVSDRFAFAGALAVLTAFQGMNDWGTSVAASYTFYTLEDHDHWALFGAAAMASAALLLASTRGRSFDEAPALRHRPLKPQFREGVTVLIIAALPWVTLGGVTWMISVLPMSPVAISHWLKAVAIIFLVSLAATAYWVYSIHGEVAHIYPSSKLFTPRAALLFFLLVPLATPILMITLGAVLREVREHRPSASRRSSGWFNAWCVVFPPVAMGMVQDQMNELAEAQAASDSVSPSQAT
ncbi:hypothetical protein LMG26689_00315 [Achromobacter animicus]|uniref:hypothetical protein n=1 Tax=Achromobacter animicus TaxID=1389935 RepID=UPI0014684EC5|nr:hypothetical protein [Achromobacter animicus]CAB3818153.1 hypothetical protein LMG26689_00315 [Achromobacter animicus]